MLFISRKGTTVFLYYTTVLLPIISIVMVGLLLYAADWSAIWQIGLSMIVLVSLFGALLAINTLRHYRRADQLHPELVTPMRHLYGCAADIKANTTIAKFLPEYTDVLVAIRRNPSASAGRIAIVLVHQSTMHRLILGDWDQHYQQTRLRVGGPEWVIDIIEAELSRALSTARRELVRTSMVPAPEVLYTMLAALTGGRTDETIVTR